MRKEKREGGGGERGVYVVEKGLASSFFVTKLLFYHD
jgi:hypothetical protein